MSRFLMLVSAIAVAFAGKAQTPEVPAITMYYPGASDESPMELKHTSTAYLYFTTGSHIVSATAQVVQDGNALGTCVYRPTTPGASTVAMKPSVAENAVLETIATGLFTLNVYEVVYTVDGVDYTYSDLDNPVGSVTYRRNSPNGKVVGETGFEDGMVLSYFPEGGEAGVKTFTFDKPVLPSGLRVMYRYGMGEVERTASLPFSLSDDGLTLTIDVRGRCYDVNTLAPGVTFVGDDGNPVPPPDFITMIVEGLQCTDGTKISSVATSLDGNHSTVIEGQIYRSYNYTDLTFPTPYISKVEFFNSAKPSVRFSQLTPDADRMDVFLKNIEYLASCAVSISVSGTDFDIEPENVVVGNDRVTVPLPSNILMAESGTMVVSVVAPVFTVDDGAIHIIAPVNLAYISSEVNSVAELKALAASTSTRFALDGLKITMVNENGYIFGEDATGGIQIYDEKDLLKLQQGMQLYGTVFGTYGGYGIFFVEEVISCSAGITDVAKGTMIDSFDELVSGTYDNCLVSLLNAESMQMKLNQEYDAVLINDQVVIVTELIPGYTLPAEIESVTGVLYKDVVMDMYMLLVRDADDVNSKLTGITLPASDAEGTDIYDLRGVKVCPGTHSLRGIYIISGRKVLIK